MKEIAPDAVGVGDTLKKGQLVIVASGRDGFGEWDVDSLCVVTAKFTVKGIPGSLRIDWADAAKHLRSVRSKLLYFR